MTAALMNNTMNFVTPPLLKDTTAIGMHINCSHQQYSVQCRPQTCLGFVASCRICLHPEVCSMTDVRLAILISKASRTVLTAC